MLTISNVIIKTQGERKNKTHTLKKNLERHLLNAYQVTNPSLRQPLSYLIRLKQFLCGQVIYLNLISEYDAGKIELQTRNSEIKAKTERFYQTSLKVAWLPFEIVQYYPNTVPITKSYFNFSNKLTINLHGSHLWRNYNTLTALLYSYNIKK